jgi:AcrR family transcriptional regulator
VNASRPSSLNARRKAATELDIARVAAALFARQGTEATTAEQIAGEAGVAVRTFYRYFRAKQDAVRPLLASGAAGWAARLDTVEPGTPLIDAFVDAARFALSDGGPGGPDALRHLRGLLRAARDDAALRAVWYQVTHESEDHLRGRILSWGAVDGELEARLAATAATHALRVALETWAAGDAPPYGTPDSPAELSVRCLREFAAGVPGLADDARVGGHGDRVEAAPGS